MWFLFFGYSAAKRLVHFLQFFLVSDLKIIVFYMQHGVEYLDLDFVFAWARVNVVNIVHIRQFALLPFAAFLPFGFATR